MSVKLFHAPQIQPQRLFQDATPDTIFLLTLLKQLHAELADYHGLHALVLNGEHAEFPADVVVVSEHGIGMLNIQTEAGTISRDNEVWCADGQPVTVSSRLGYRNPHKKVQQSAEKIRDYLMKPAGSPLLQGRPITWVDLFFDTAVCFPHPDVKLELFRKYYSKEVQEGRHVKQWERFTLLERAEVAQWVKNLCFEAELDALLSVQSYRLTTNQILRIVTEFLQAQELPALPETKATRQTFGMIVLKEQGQVSARFPLDQESMTMGRDPVAGVSIPKKFINVSRIHAKLTCSPRGVSIEDCSRNGTYVDGVRIYAPMPLRFGQQILLGGDKPMDGVCELHFTEK